MKTATKHPTSRLALACVLAALSAMLGACAGTRTPPATLTVRNDAMHAVDVHYAVLAPDGNPATPGEAGVQHMTIEAGGVLSQPIVDPTGAVPNAARGSTIMRVLVTLAGAGPEVGQWIDLSPPGPFVLRASPFGTGVKVEREADQEIDDRQMQELIQAQPPQPGRAGRQ